MNEKTTWVLRAIRKHEGGSYADLYAETKEPLGLKAPGPTAAFYQHTKALEDAGLATFDSRDGWHLTTQGELMLRLLEGEWTFVEVIADNVMRLGTVGYRNILGTDFYAPVHCHRSAPAAGSYHDDGSACDETVQLAFNAADATELTAADEHSVTVHLPDRTITFGARHSLLSQQVRPYLPEMASA